MPADEVARRPRYGRRARAWRGGGPTARRPPRRSTRRGRRARRGSARSRGTYSEPFQNATRLAVELTDPHRDRGRPGWRWRGRTRRAHREAARPRPDVTIQRDPSATACIGSRRPPPRKSRAGRRKGIPFRRPCAALRRWRPPNEPNSVPGPKTRCWPSFGPAAEASLPSPVGSTPPSSRRSRTRALGRAAEAVTLAGPAVSAEEVDRAARASRKRSGSPTRSSPSTRSRDPSYRANPSNRCYFCRSVETRARLRVWGAQRGVAPGTSTGSSSTTSATTDPGSSRDGRSRLRPPARLGPLAEGRCPRASRSPPVSRTGTPRRTRASPPGSGTARRSRSRSSGGSSSPSAGLRERGFRRVRVRVGGDCARVEVDPEEVARLASRAVASDVRSAPPVLGFTDVAIDPAGYRARPGA